MLEDVVGVAGWVLAGLVAWVLVAGLVFSLFVRRARRVLEGGGEPPGSRPAGEQPPAHGTPPAPRSPDEPPGAGTAA